MPWAIGRDPDYGFLVLDRRSVGGRTPEDLAEAAFTWHRFAAVQIWLFVCFLIYVTATQLSAALGPGKLKQLMFRRR